MFNPVILNFDELRNIRNDYWIQNSFFPFLPDLCFSLPGNFSVAGYFIQSDKKV